MKVLICGECSDSLTTVARNLNRLLSEQMRSSVLIATPTTASVPALLEVPVPNKPAALLTEDHA
jgi:hypothetical protein